MTLLVQSRLRDPSWAGDTLVGGPDTPSVGQGGRAGGDSAAGALQRRSKLFGLVETAGLRAVLPAAVAWVPHELLREPTPGQRHRDEEPVGHRPGETVRLHERCVCTEGFALGTVTRWHTAPFPLHFEVCFLNTNTCRRLIPLKFSKSLWSRGTEPGKCGGSQTCARGDQGRAAGAPSSPGKVMGREKLTPKLNLENTISATLALLPSALLHSLEGMRGSEHAGTPARSPLLAPGVASLCLPVLVAS